MFSKFQTHRPVRLQDLEKVEDDDWQIRPWFLSLRPTQPSCLHLFYKISAILGFISIVVVITIWGGVDAEVSMRSPIPTFPVETVILQPDKRYEEPPNAESDALWEADFPGDRGFFVVENPDDFGLPPGLPESINGSHNVYGVTWTHEYHCLSMIRAEFWKALDGSSTLYRGLGAKATPSKSDEAMLSHIQHCFNYIRQLTLCRADSTVEWAAQSLEDHHDEAGSGGHDHSPHIDGYGIPHQCTNKDAMFEYMLARQPPARKGGKAQGLGH